MLKILLFILGLAAGAVGAISLLLSRPVASSEGWKPPSGDPLTDKIQTLKAQLREASEEGKRSREQTEEKLKRRLDAYRRGSTGKLSAS